MDLELELRDLALVLTSLDILVTHLQKENITYQLHNLVLRIRRNVHNTIAGT